MNIRHDFPIWAPRLSKGMIKKLYKNDAAGINDEELVDMVGYMLYNRCRSFLIAVEAFHGQASCPLCEVKIRHNREKNFILLCKNCNWELSWGDYFSTIQHKQLSGAKPVLELFSQFTEKFPKLGTYQEKMFHIDQLIHGFHYFFKNNKPTRPVAVNLIKGRLSDVVKFLDDLSYSNSSTPGIRDTKNIWQENLNTAQNWMKT